jgi:signal transduction histidine kinase
LQNLIENALYFSSLTKSVQRPAVKVNVIKQNGHIAINLEDNGCGIDPAVKDNIWNMFFVGHERSTGNGLGLYITKKAVRTLQGEVACISGNEGATIFEVRLPVNGRC